MENIPERCPKCLDLEEWKHREVFRNVEDAYGYLICELRVLKTGKHQIPSEWIFGTWYCFSGKYLDCPLFSKWFWDQVIKKSKIKLKK